MRLFIYELKKIWNWRILTLIAALAVLIWFSFLSEALRSYDSLTTHGIFGSYQKMLFERYGDTLEPEELADFDIPGKKAAIRSEMDAIIASEAIFAEHQIGNYMEFEAFSNTDTDTMNEDERTRFSEATLLMHSKLSLSSETQTLDEWYDSPQMRMQTLDALEHTYVHYEPRLRVYMDRDSRPVVVQAAEKILHTHNTSLIRYDLVQTFSLFAAVVAVFSVIAVIVLIVPLLPTDRMQKINLVQYSSAIGRRMMGIQLGASMVSAGVLSLLLVAMTFTLFLLAGAADYWDASILLFASSNMNLYDLTFGTYTLILAAMILVSSVGAACFSFLLARFSANMMTALIKIVPLGVAVSAIAVLSINMALSFNNIVFSTLFRGRWDMPEVIVCVCMGVLGMLAAWFVTWREKRVDVA